MSQAPRNDLARITLAVLFIGGLILGAFWVLRPFVAATIWATMIVVSTWPMLLWFQHRLWRSRGLAVTVMTLLLLLLFVAPLSLAIGTIVSHADDIIVEATALSGRDLPPAPPWVENLPLVGAKVKQFWDQAVESGARGLVGRLAPYADDIVKWFVAQAGSVGFVFVQFLLTVVIAALMYAGGEATSAVLRRFAVRLAGPQGDDVVTLGGQAIRGVALGVGVTAVVQAGMGGVGLAIAGVPFTGLFTAVMLLLCIAQLGPALVLFPAVAWMFWKGDTAWAVFLLVWSLIVVTMDNFLRPWLIQKGADLPLLLIFAGVIGGLLAFGLVGIFVGPVVLAVAYRLLGNWIDSGPAAPAARAPR
ncbi:MAG: AI-2E family transporter YdiK [Burkholderiales bacterium]|nr:AI-2E family transporter YdiK [Burkholderiales bacterium]